MVLGYGFGDLVLGVWLWGFGCIFGFRVGYRLGIDLCENRQSIGGVEIFVQQLHPVTTDQFSSMATIVW